MYKLRQTTFVRFVPPPTEEPLGTQERRRVDEAPRLVIAELEERIAPRAGESLNHNETML